MGVFISMTKNIKKYSLDINGNELSVEVGRVANLANGSCVLTLGETVVLATASALKLSLIHI